MGPQQEVFTMCLAQSVQDVPVLTGGPTARTANCALRGAPASRGAADGLEESYLNRSWAKVYRLLRQLCHSCEVPGEM